MSAALTQAQSIVEAAETRARKLEEQAEKSYLEAKQRGYEEGLEAGKTEALAEAVRLIEQTEALNDSLAREAAQLALAIASMVIDQELATKPDTVNKIARRALRESVIGESVVVLCNPKDVDALLASQQDFRRLAGGAAVAIEVDDTIARGGCIVRTEFGEVDASIERLLRNIANRLELNPEREKQR
jgi:flagellar assembly protein FliH